MAAARAATRRQFRDQAATGGEDARREALMFGRIDLVEATSQCGNRRGLRLHAGLVGDAVDAAREAAAATRKLVLKGIDPVA